MSQSRLHSSYISSRCCATLLQIAVLSHSFLSLNQSNAPGTDGGACHWFDQAQQVVFENNTCTGNNPMVSKAAAAVSKALCRVVGCVLCLGWTHAVLIGDGLCCVRYYCPLLYRPWETTSTPVSRSSVHTAAHAAVPLCCAVLSISQAIAANKMEVQTVVASCSTCTFTRTRSLPCGVRKHLFALFLLANKNDHFAKTGS